MSMIGSSQRTSWSSLLRMDRADQIVDKKAPKKWGSERPRIFGELNRGHVIVAKVNQLHHEPSWRTVLPFRVSICSRPRTEPLLP